jgi:hypothetical protein
MDLNLAHIRQYWNQQTRLGYTLVQTHPRAARRNYLHAIALILLFNTTIFLTLIARSPWPLLFGILLLATFVQRSALQARHTTIIRKRLLYGVHTHVSQIPLFIGQLNYRTRRKQK